MYFIAILLSSALIVETVALYACPKHCSGDNCNVEASSCKYGVKSLCGRDVCARGPGERCGGYQSMRGKCASGLICDNCGFCMGCFQATIFDEQECFRSDASKCYSF